jgi:hypothetical protein
MGHSSRDSDDVSVVKVYSDLSCQIFCVNASEGHLESEGEQPGLEWVPLLHDAGALGKSRVVRLG